MTPEKLSLPHLKKIIAIISGKGGVGKSTISFNLAVGLAQKGLSVGLLDADIYGPSLPKLLGLMGPAKIENQQFIPFEKYGIKAMSMGFLINEEMPVIWRGPMIMTAVKQLFKDVAWGGLDILIVDMPPGTGDAHLTLCQSIPLDGVVIVSTPQDLAWIDAFKALMMFQKLQIPILGVIENMSGFECAHCHHITDIFKEGGTKSASEKLRVPFLGSVPLDPVIVQNSDRGLPSLKNFEEIVHTLLLTLSSPPNVTSSPGGI
jgi:ATP-binding protein involved in chromosome partitioning